MDRNNYDKIRNLVSEIDSLSGSADIIKEIIENFNNNGGTAKIYANTSNDRYETKLSSETAKIAFRDVLNSYNSSILKAKEKLNEIIDKIADVE